MRLIVHPAALRMLDGAGIDHARYIGILDSWTMLDSWRHGDADIAALPRHSAGLGSKALVMIIFLSDGVHFVTGPDRHASRLTVKGVLPETVRTRLVGRHVTEMVSHPVLEISGLDIDDIRESTNNSTGEVDTYVGLAPVEWPTIGDTGKAAGLIQGLKRRLAG